MSDFFNVIGSIVTFLNSLTVIGSITIWHILLTSVVIFIIGKLVKGSKD